MLRLFPTGHYYSFGHTHTQTHTKEPLNYHTKISVYAPRVKNKINTN